MWLLIFTIVGFAAIFWALAYVPGIYAKARHDEALNNARSALRFGAYMTPHFMREQQQQEAFQRKIIAVAIEAGLTPEEADLWISRPDFIYALMTFPAAFEAKKIYGEVVERATNDFARDEAIGWVNLHRR